MSSFVAFCLAVAIALTSLSIYKRVVYTEDTVYHMNIK